jgi:hypothetical protein
VLREHKLSSCSYSGGRCARPNGRAVDWGRGCQGHVTKWAKEPLYRLARFTASEWHEVRARDRPPSVVESQAGQEAQRGRGLVSKLPRSIMGVLEQADASMPVIMIRKGTLRVVGGELERIREELRRRQAAEPGEEQDDAEGS